MYPTMLSRKRLIPIIIIVLWCSTHNNAETQHDHFYSRLSTWGEYPTARRVDSLKNYIQFYPDYLPAYLKLEEELFETEQSEKLFRYCRRFAEKSPTYANAQWMLARYFNFRNQPDKALGHFEKAVKDQTTPYEILFAYRELAFQNQNFEQAKNILDKFEWSEKQRTVLRAHDCMLKSEYADAIALFQSVLPFMDCFLGMQYFRCHYRDNDPDAALQIAQQAQRRARTEGNLYYEAYFFLAALKCRYWLDDQLDVSSDIQMCRDMLRRSNNIRGEMQLAQFEAYAAHRQQSYDDAIHLNQKALLRYLVFFEWRLAARCYQDIAEAYYLTSRYSPALETLEASTQFAKRIKNHGLSAWAWRLYGIIYRDLALYNLSLKYFEKAKQAALKTGDVNLIENIDIPMQELRARQVSSSRAVDVYTNWLADIKTGDHQTDIFFPTYSLAETLENLGEYERASFLYQKALEAATQRDHRVNQAWARAGLHGIKLKLDKSRSALDELHNVLRAATALENSDLLYSIHLRLGNFHKENDEFDHAIHNYLAVIDESEKERQELRANELAIGFFSDRQEAYQRLSECYYYKFMRDNNPQNLGDIFKCEELMHARALKDEINNINRKTGLNKNQLLNYDKLLSEFQRLQRQLRDLQSRLSQTELDSLLSELQLYKHDIVSENIRLGNLDSTRSTDVSPSRLIDVQNALVDQTAILYHITDQLSFALIIQSDSSTVVPLPIQAAELDSLVNILMNPLHHIDEHAVMTIPFHADIAHNLYTNIFKPIELDCALDSQIFVVPTGSLANLPLDMLLDATPDQRTYSVQDRPDYAKFFLSHKYEFYYGPSTHILFRQPVTCSPGMLIVADPFKGDAQKTDKSFTLRLRTGWRFDPLPYAHVEAASIKKLAPKTKMLKHDKATEAKVKKLAPKYAMLHIASHAFVDTTFDIFSGLALADDKESDGLLMGFEIADAEFPCHLVTLSACETGRGSLINGEGALGLPRQFLLAGSCSVIMSKWKVDDAFTADFMPTFYRHFLKEGLSKVSALTQTKRDILSNINAEATYHYQHPFFWAAFNLYGDAGTENEAFAVNHFKGRSFLLLLTGIGVAAAGLFLLTLRKKNV